jgi:prepilin-type N-terminal cleavage/methylation domain-containing protein
MLARHRTRAFSLIELVIVVVIIGIIGAIAIPRMSRGASGAQDSALVANLAVLRNAIDLFVTEHGGKIPSADDITNALLKYSNAAGTAFSDSKDTTNYFGPYLRSVPALPVGAKKGAAGIAAADGAGVGWIYNATTGTIKANCADSEKDAAGVAYNTY